MNDELLNTLFTRRKEGVTRLAICLFVSAFFAVAGRAPISFIALPPTLIEGGLSTAVIWGIGQLGIAFVWGIGPPILIVLQAYALHGIAEAEQLRRFLNAKSWAEGSSAITFTKQFGEEIPPIWRKNYPPVIHIVLALVLLAPMIANVVLFSSYLNLVRPVNGRPRFASRTLQIADAMVGIGGWAGFFPIAPSLQDALRSLEMRAQTPEEKLKYETEAEKLPWIYYPIQTWVYVFLLALSLDGVLAGGAYMSGTSFFGDSFFYRISRWFSKQFRKLGHSLTKGVRQGENTGTRETRKFRE